MFILLRMRLFYKSKMEYKIMQDSLNKGFTLLEMLVVLVIIGMLAGLVGPRLFSHVDESKIKTVKVQVKMLKGAVGTLYLDMGRYPTDEEGLTLLTNSPDDDNFRPYWKGPYLEDTVPLDPWHHPYQYSVPGADGHPFALYSLGADGKIGGTEYNTDIGVLPADSSDTPGGDRNTFDIQLGS